MNPNNSNIIPNVKNDDKLSSIDSENIKKIYDFNKDKNNSSNFQINQLNNKDSKNKPNQDFDDDKKPSKFEFNYNKVKDENIIPRLIQENEFSNLNNPLNDNDSIKINNLNDENMEQNRNNIEREEDFNPEFDNKDVFNSLNNNKENSKGNIVTNLEYEKNKKPNNLQLSSINNNNDNQHQKKYIDFQNNNVNNIIENDISNNSSINSLINNKQKNNPDKNPSIPGINFDNFSKARNKNINNQIYDIKHFINSKNSEIDDGSKNFTSNDENSEHYNLSVRKKSRNKLIPEKDIGHEKILNDYNSINRKPEINDIDLNIPISDYKYNIKREKIPDFKLTYNNNESTKYKVDFSDFDNIKDNNEIAKKYGLDSNYQTIKKDDYSDSHPINKISSNLSNNNQNKKNNLSQSYSSSNNTKKNKSKKLPLIDTSLLNSIKNPKPEIINEYKTPISYLNQDYHYRKISEEIPKKYFNFRKSNYKKSDLLLNFDFPPNTKNHKKNAISLNDFKFNLDNKGNNKSNEIDFDLSPNENINSNLNKEQGLVKQIPKINIEEIKMNLKKNKKKIINDIDSIKSYNTENQNAIQDSKQGNEKIIKEIEKLNKEISEMKNEKIKNNNFKDRLKTIKTEGFDKILKLPTKERNYSTTNIILKNNLKEKDYLRSKSYANFFSRRLNFEEDNEIDDNENPNEVKKISPLGLF